MIYFAKFDNDGNRTETHAADGMPYSYNDLKNMSDFVELSNEDYEKYCVGYIRGTDGQPVERPVPELTKQQKLATLEADYKSAVNELQSALAVAQLRDDTALIADIQSDFNDLQESYQAEKEAIENGIDNSETM